MKKLVGLGLMTIAILSSAIVGFASEDNSFYKFGQSISAYDKEVQKSPGLANDEVINAKEVHALQMFYEHIENKDSQAARKEAIKQVVEDTILLQEAEKRNLTVSEDEAREFAKKQREELGKSSNAEEIQKAIDGLIQGLGISEEEQWTDYVVKGYMKQNTISKLRSEVLEGIEDQAKRNETWEEFVKTLTKSSSIDLKSIE